MNRPTWRLGQTKNFGGNNSMTKKDDTNLGIVVVGLVIAFLIITGFMQGWFKLPSGASVIHPPTPPYPTQSGQAYCPATGTLANVNSPPPGCLNVAQKVYVTLLDQYGTTSFGTSWGCRIESGGPGPTTSAGSGKILENTGALVGGQCQSQSYYLPGQPLIVEVCDQSSACTSTSFGQQETVYYSPIPSPGSVGTGTVAFCSAPCSQSSPTDTATLSLTILAGQQTASNTPYTSTFQLPNGTNINSGSTCYVNEAKGSHSCYLGASNYQLPFQLTYQLSYVTSSFPYGAGFLSFNEYDQPLKGQLSAGVTFTLAAGTGTQMCTSSGGSFGTTPTYGASAATNKLFAYTPSDQSMTRATDGSGNIINGLTGTVPISVILNCLPLTTSANTNTLTFNLYVYFSLSYFTANGVVNNEAVTQATQYTLTLQAH
jgi:hypothetical protein